MQFADIHIHALYDCDDGAKSLEHMYQMIDVAYEDGTRYMCLTPHYNPGYFGNDTTEKSRQAFETLLEYAKEKYPDLQLALGNELRYNPGCEEWLSKGECRPMNNSKYVLVDFSAGEEKTAIAKGLDRLLNVGYIPILAHAERYTKLRGDIKFLKEQRDNGVLLQMDARAVLGDFGIQIKCFSKKILRHQLADFISSDAHDRTSRPPGIKEAYEYIRKNYGQAYADHVCCYNAKQLIFGQLLRKEQI